MQRPGKARPESASRLLGGREDRHSTQTLPTFAAVRKSGREIPQHPHPLRRVRQSIPGSVSHSEPEERSNAIQQAAFSEIDRFTGQIFSSRLR